MNLSTSIGIAATTICIFACVGVAYTNYRDTCSDAERRIILYASLISIPVIVLLYGLVYFLNRPELQFVMLGIAGFVSWRVSSKINNLRQIEGASDEIDYSNANDGEQSAAPQSTTRSESKSK